MYIIGREELNPPYDAALIAGPFFIGERNFVRRGGFKGCLIVRLPDVLFQVAFSFGHTEQMFALLLS